MRVHVVGVPTVTGPGGSLSGAELGGRRAHVVLTALALAGGPLTSSALAELVWRGAPPETWPVALRGVVRGLRTAVAAAGSGDQELIETVPGGYRLAAGVEVDLDATESSVREAARLLENGRHAAAGELLATAVAARGSAVLPGEDDPWFVPHRTRVDQLSRRARELLVRAARGAGDTDRAVQAARDWVASTPLDEGAHRALIESLEAAGDRPGVVRAFESYRALLAEELGLDPSPEIVASYLHALGEPTAGRHLSLPLPTSTFLARDKESRLLGAAVAEPGLVTVVGRGGVGKSRLVAEVLRRGRDEFQAGHWVQVEPIGEEELVPASVAFALDVDPGEDPVEAVVRTLSALGRTVLVLDGAEAALDGVAGLADAVTSRCPQLSVVATSRVPLGVAGERILALEPLGLGSQDEVTAADPVVRLLIDRVRERGGQLGPEQATGDLLHGVLDRCAGLPLAVELVAAQLAVTSPGDLADQLDEFLDTAIDPVRAMARSGYATLSGEEAALFRRFAVLEGPVPLWLVREVAAADDLPRARVLRLLGTLASYGLLREERAAERWRWSQDDELHRYARELLLATEEASESYARLAAAIRSRLPDDPRSPPGPFAAAVTDVLPSVRSLFGAATAGQTAVEPSLELAFRLHRYWAATNVGEGRFWLGRLLDAMAGPGTGSDWVGYATYALGYLEYWSGDSDHAIARLREAAALLTGVDDQYVARALIFLAGLLDDVDQGSEAVITIRGAVEIADRFGPDLQMPAVMGIGSVLSERGDPEAAEHAVRAIELVRSSAHAEQLTVALPTATMICWMVGADDLARRFAAEAMPLHDSGPRISRVVLYSAAAGLALGEGDAAGAAELATTADKEGTELGVERELPLVRAILARAQLSLGNSEAAAEVAGAALEAGLAMAFDFPLAVGLETAVHVLRATGTGTAEEWSELLSAAADIRNRGDRPPPVTLRDVPPFDLSAPGDTDARTAARLALKLLAAR